MERQDKHQEFDTSHDEIKPDGLTQEKHAEEGFVPVDGGQIWYEKRGQSLGIPLVVLHGGPGSSHLSMRGLFEISTERPVILYDQLGCGKSDRPSDKNLWRIERFVRELEQLRDYLGLHQVHLLGHSWGTMLLTDYLLTHPRGVVSAIFSGPCLSAPRWISDANRLRSQLPEDVQITLRECEANGQTDSEAYREATEVYMKQHGCRVEISKEDKESRKEAFGEEVYHTMWGPSEFYATGNLKDFDRTDSLHELRLPTLFTCGRFDEATPESTAYYASLVPGSKVHVYENSAHVPQVEQPDQYIQVVREFLNQVESKPVA